MNCPFCNSKLEIEDDLAFHNHVLFSDHLNERHFYSTFINVNNEKDFKNEEYFSDNILHYELYLSKKDNLFQFSVSHIPPFISGPINGQTIVEIYNKIIKSKAFW